ncbi:MULTISPECIES: M14 family metallopeptidase [Alteromonas]|jgi:carboxypeptidase T|uniref:carboxypeptidase T n=1 Tax=Alteromonas stellipolaris TaxID=233316 RepID=A0AAW7Z406_9ALTE|nr:MULTISPECIES: M14 family metallopeptidase [Alteromonas]AMJ91474.1 peptidase [Alteromonas sp. Mac2]ALM89710.1 Carboxypeptidase A1 precursor [Alteromonas stellipolaris LMG 21856]AMJ75205.1 peptidase [Alteromonas stellipolaris]AMJ87611.1 peptidase [Alteromonas sp. Mac1]ANB21677.1 peptidase [Alteromonas stellipolaris]
MKKQYTSYQETMAFLEQAQEKYPELIRVHSIGTTWEGRPIMMATLSANIETADSKPALLFTGTIHAREWIGNELAIKFIDNVLTNIDHNPSIQQALSRNTLYMVPCLNPDGFEYSRTHFSFWRKNRRDNGDGTFGVDLNRNFGVRFKRSADTTVNTYSGPAAFSEPETAAIRDFVLTHKNITIALDYHSQGNVFFPAHKFNHESEIEGTDLNVLCANMNREIHKVTGRQYGIHRGKPPTNLINGSGREYYYSLGIISAVVEVGTRNIPDYMANMSQSVDENVPAVLYALSEAKNYSDEAPARVDNFTIESVGVYEATLCWDYPESDDIYFELYRSETVKSPCREDNLIAIIGKHTFTDVQLKSGQKYFYNIRAVNKVTDTKSPFSPEIKLKTQLSEDEYFRGLFPSKRDIGYVGQYTLEKNRDHFGYNSLFVGVNKRRGICYGVIAFNMENLPEDARIKNASFSLYPMNRVNAKVENFGEWTVSILDPSEISDITDFNQIHQAKPIQTLGDEIRSDKLTQGIWSHWDLNVAERRIIRKSIKNGTLLLRVEGPRKLPLGADSQMMQFDIGYGKFGSGIHYRPNLEVIYTLPSKQVELTPSSINTVSKAEVKQNELQSGFDKNGDVVYGQMTFLTENLPDPKKTVITEAYLTMSNENALPTSQDIRFTIELAGLEDLDYQSVKNREKKEFIGYEVSNAQLKDKNSHNFIFDSYCREALEEMHAKHVPFHFVVRSTSSSAEKNMLVNWHDLHSNQVCKLVIKYIERRKEPLPAPANLSVTLENRQVKLSWSNPKHADLVGAFVVRNRFHSPRSPLDGVKLYAGSDEYTYDNFGNPNVEKYYSVFAYDDVPNYSAPVSVYYSSEEVIPVEEEKYEKQEEEDDDEPLID